MSDGGFVPAPWVFVLIALAIAAAGLVRYRPVVGFRLAAGVLLASAATALFEATGH